MNRIVRLSETHGPVIEQYYPAIVRWRKETRETWQNYMDNGTLRDFSICLDIDTVNKDGKRTNFVSWWFSYQNFVEFEFEDGTVKTFKVKHGENLTDDRETFKELVEFIDEYVNNGYEIVDKTAVVLDDEDDLLVV